MCLGLELPILFFRVLSILMFRVRLMFAAGRQPKVPEVPWSGHTR
jgi:hypothetical protein